MAERPRTRFIVTHQYNEIDKGARCGARRVKTATYLRSKSVTGGREGGILRLQQQAVPLEKTPTGWTQTSLALKKAQLAV